MKIKCINKRSGSIGFQGDIMCKEDYKQIIRMCPKECYKWEVIK